MCQCKSIDFNKCTATVQDADRGGGCAYVGAGAYGNSVLPTQSRCEAKTALQIKSIKKKKRKEKMVGLLLADSYLNGDMNLNILHLKE